MSTTTYYVSQFLQTFIAASSFPLHTFRHIYNKIITFIITGIGIIVTTLSSRMTCLVAELLKFKDCSVTTIVVLLTFSTFVKFLSHSCFRFNAALATTTKTYSALKNFLAFSQDSVDITSGQIHGTWGDQCIQLLIHVQFRCTK